MTSGGAGSGTGTVAAARADARARAGLMAAAMPHVPASQSPHIPPGVPAEALVWAETLAPAGHTHRVVAPGPPVPPGDPPRRARPHRVPPRAGPPRGRADGAATPENPGPAPSRGRPPPAVR